MLSQRVAQQSARRLLTRDAQLLRPFTPALLSSQQTQLQKRHTTSPSTPHLQPANPSDAYTILAAQRLNRPIAPHLTIYRPQVTWYLSALNRITGSALSGGFYLFGAAYLASPLLGWHLESAHLAEMFGSLGVVTKGLVKFTVAWPFTFHCLNGVRHLVWDTGREFANGQVVKTGWAVVGLSLVGAGGLAFAW